MRPSAAAGLPARSLAARPLGRCRTQRRSRPGSRASRSRTPALLGLGARRGQRPGAVRARRRPGLHPGLDDEAAHLGHGVVRRWAPSTSSPPRWSAPRAGQIVLVGGGDPLPGGQAARRRPTRPAPRLARWPGRPPAALRKAGVTDRSASATTPRCFSGPAGTRPGRTATHDDRHPDRPRSGSTRAGSSTGRARPGPDSGPATTAADAFAAALGRHGHHRRTGIAPADAAGSAARVGAGLVDDAGRRSSSTCSMTATTTAPRCCSARSRSAPAARASFADGTSGRPGPADQAGRPGTRGHGAATAAGCPGRPGARRPPWSGARGWRREENHPELRGRARPGCPSPGSTAAWPPVRRRPTRPRARVVARKTGTLSGVHGLAGVVRTTATARCWPTPSWSTAPEERVRRHGLAAPGDGRAEHLRLPLNPHGRGRRQRARPGCAYARTA